MLAEILSYEFMRNALLAGLLTSLACGVIGSYVVVKRIVFISGGISHTAYGGVGLGYFFGFDPLLGATIFSVGAALAIGLVTRLAKTRIDSLIGIIWAFGMALGIVMINLSPGYAPDLMSYLFGNILTVPTSDLILLGVLDALILASVLVFYNHFLAVSFDEEYAEVTGVRVSFYYFLMLTLVALTVVVLIRAVGIILVIALLTIPAALAGEFTGKLRNMMIIASLFGAIFTVGGLLLSYSLGRIFQINVPSGATIILFATISYPILVFISRKAVLFRRVFT
jgi:zinc transport system permease protein